MTLRGPPFAALRGRGLVRAIPAMWCVAFSALVGLEMLYRGRDLGLPERTCVVRACALTAVCAVETLLVLFAATRPWSRLARVVGGAWMVVLVSGSG